MCFVIFLVPAKSFFVSNRLFLLLPFFLFSENISAQIKAKNGSVQDVLDRYYELGKALSGSETKKALEKAKKLEAEIVSNNFISYFGSTFSALQSASDIAQLRLVYYQLSQKLRKILPYSETLDDVVYVLHCSACFHDSGAFWLSEDKSIHNPYLETENKSCEKFIETIKPMVK